MKKFPILLLTLAATPAIAAGDPPPKPVKFAPGKTATNLKGVVKGYKTASYSLDVAAGQVFQVLFKPSNRSCYFNGTANGAAAAEHIGSSSGNEFSKNVTANGTYRFDVYLMRNAARRAETCRYELSVELTGPQGGASSGVSDAILRDNCKSETAKVYQVQLDKVTISAAVVKAKGGGFTLDGTIDKGAEGIKKMRCIFRANRTLDNVMAMTPDGE